MSNTTQPADFSDLWNSLLRRARVDSNQTINATQAKEFINTALFDMHLGNGERFPWAERAGRLLTQASYSTGSVAVSKGSSSVVGSGSAWNTPNDFGVANVRAGGKIVFGGDETVYEVLSVASNLALTLTDVYRGPTLSGGSYLYFEDEYDLAADFLKPLDKTRFDGRGEIPIIDRREFRRRFTRIAATGPIIACAIFDKAFSGDTTPRRRVRLYRPPSEARYIPYAYVTSSLAVTAAGVEQAQLVNDTDEPIVPLYARHLIVLKALEHWYRDKKNDSRSQEAKAEYVDGVTRLLGDVEVGAQRPQIQPNVSGYMRRSRTPYRGNGRTRKHTLGTAFDENLE